MQQELSDAEQQVQQGLQVPLGAEPPGLQGLQVPPDEEASVQQAQRVLQDA